MTLDEYQHTVITTLAEYQRPGTLAKHLRKLGEEVGELAEAVAGASVSLASYDAGLISYEEKDAKEICAIEECIDVIFVTLSLLDMLDGDLEKASRKKLEILTQRVIDGIVGSTRRGDHA